LTKIIRCAARRCIVGYVVALLRCPHPTKTLREMTDASALDTALTLHPIPSEPDRDGRATARFSCVFDPSWYQGRGTYGGVVTAQLARAFQTLVPTRDARVITVHFCAPATGEGTIEATLEREGANVTHLTARLTHVRRGKVVTLATASAVFGRPLAEHDFGDHVAPRVPPPHEVPVFVQTPGWPVFARHFEFRPCLGYEAFRGAPEGHLGGWFRAVEPQSPDLAYVCALFDAWPPSALPLLLPPPRPAASVDLTFHFFRRFPLDVPSDAPWLYEARTPVVRGGWGEEHATLWDTEGRLVARARQNVALF
jgi:acyl-CoA thioesterase